MNSSARQKVLSKRCPALWKYLQGINLKTEGSSIYLVMRLHMLRPVLNLKRIQDAEQVLGANILTETSVHLHSDRLDLKLNINICTCSALHWADKHYLSKASFHCISPDERIQQSCYQKLSRKKWHWWCCTYIESQHGWFWEGPLEVIWSNPFPQAGLARASCPGPHLQIWRLHHFPGQPVLGFGHPHSKKRYFLQFKRDPSL